METTKRTGSVFKFAIFSAIGIFIFFINITVGEKSGVPLVLLINYVKGLVPNTFNLAMITFFCVTTLGTSIWAKLPSAPQWIKKTHEKDSIFSYFTYATATIFSIMVVLNMGPAFIIDPAVGLSSLNVARDSFYTLTIAGTLVVFLVEFGLLEFLGVLMEPIMRKLFKVPGKASIDALSSFVCAPSFGVMLTSDLYKNKVYTDKESVAITTCFSICSLGAFAFLAGMANAGEYYSELILSAFVVTFIMAAIMVRIPPITKKKDVYSDGEVQTEEQRKTKGYGSHTLPDAVSAAVLKTEKASLTSMPKALIAAFGFGRKVCTYVISLSVIFLALANYTSLVEWLGIPLVPILNIFGLKDVELIAPGILSGFFALSLPSTLLKGTAVAASSGFFAVLLSTSQIIFFTESANVMLDSAIPVKFKDLLVIFLIRTAILIPICSLITYIVFGFSL